MDRIYLDWNATAPLRPQARAAMAAALDLTGNPSSVHREGRAARAAIEEARAQVAALAGAQPGDVIFTASATEANMLALTPAIERAGERGFCDRLVISSIEHPSVRAGGRFGTPEEVRVGADGVVDLGALRETLARGGRPLVSIMLANNETGIVQPVCEAARIVHEAGGLLHVDAVQAPGRIAFSMAALGADLLTLSAHKIGGPKGVGALVRGEGIQLADALIKGGGQERGLRAGTENVAGIAGFGAAATAAAADLDADAARMAALRERLEVGLLAVAPQTVIFGRASPRLPNTSLFSLPGMKAETAVIAFDLAGIAVSSGAACSSGKVQSSHVLAAMGVEPALARGAIRVSLGRDTAPADLESFQNAWIKLSESLGKGRGMAA